MADQVAAMCEQLIKAVNVMMDPETNQIYRLEALKVASSLWTVSLLLLLKWNRVARSLIRSFC